MCRNFIVGMMLATGNIVCLGAPVDTVGVVRGCLVDRTNGDPLMFTRVVVEGTTDTVVADVDGCFEILLPTDAPNGCNYLLVELPGFMPYKHRIRKKDITSGRSHRLRHRRFAPCVAEAKIKSLEERLAVLK